jgi:4a-hydroxytetrahydrobiopterin dehydratase
MSSCDLKDKKCQSCNAFTPKLSIYEIDGLLKKVNSDWVLNDELNTLYRHYKFKNWKEMMAFVNKVSVIAEEEGHHPDINIFEYRKLTLEITTHAIHSLSENDFILAAKIDELSK